MIDFRHDDIYFKVTSNQIKTKIDSRSVKSFTVTEEQGKLTTGSLVLDDPACLYYDIINRGTFFDIEWGRNYSERGGSLFRKGLTVMITSPSIKLDKTGTTTIQFKSGFSAIKDKIRKTHSGALSKVIASVMTNAGVTNQMIDFVGMDKSGDVRQDNETDFNFLTRKATEYKVFFRIGQDLGGNFVGVFADYKSPMVKNFSKQVSGTIDEIFQLDYKTGNFNVIEAGVDYQYSDKGGGRNISFVIIDGNPVKNETEKVPQKIQAMQLDEKKLFAYQKKLQDEQGFDASTKFLADVYAAKDFEDDLIKQFWTPVDYKTATPHTGLKVTAKILGVPNLTPPQKLKFNGNWPRLVTGANNIMLRSVTHNISRSGYYCDLECRDYFSL